MTQMDEVSREPAIHAMPDLRALTRMRPGLSAKLLVLTIAFVMLIEVLIFAPSVARFRVDETAPEARPVRANTGPFSQQGARLQGGSPARLLAR